MIRDVGDMQARMREFMPMFDDLIAKDALEGIVFAMRLRDGDVRFGVFHGEISTFEWIGILTMLCDSFMDRVRMEGDE